MRRLAASAVFLAAALAASADDKPLKQLEGEYKVKAISKAGMPAPEEVVREVKGVAIKGDVMTFLVMGKEEKGKIKVDATKKPAHIDISPQTGPDKGKTFPGLYKLEKGELTI